MMGSYVVVLLLSRPYNNNPHPHHPSSNWIGFDDEDDFSAAQPYRIYCPSVRPTQNMYCNKELLDFVDNDDSFSAQPNNKNKNEVQQHHHSQNTTTTCIHDYGIIYPDFQAAIFQISHPKMSDAIWTAKSQQKTEKSRRLAITPHWTYDNYQLTTDYYSIMTVII